MHHPDEQFPKNGAAGVRISVIQKEFCFLDPMTPVLWPLGKAGGVRGLERLKNQRFSANCEHQNQPESGNMGCSGRSGAIDGVEDLGRFSGLLFAF